MDVKLITGGDLESTKLINIRTGEEVKNIRIVAIENPNYEPFHSEEAVFPPGPMAPLYNFGGKAYTKKDCNGRQCLDS